MHCAYPSPNGATYPRQGCKPLYDERVLGVEP